MTRERAGYALAATALFAVELAIALFVRDRLVRPYLGDTLAVILVYLALRAATPLRVKPAVALALGIALLIELGQLVHVTRILGLDGNPIARMVLGSGFDLADLAAYALGALLVLAAERLRISRTGWRPSSRRRSA